MELLLTERKKTHYKAQEVRPCILQTQVGRQEPRFLPVHVSTLVIQDHPWQGPLDHLKKSIKEGNNRVGARRRCRSLQNYGVGRKEEQVKTVSLGRGRLIRYAAHEHDL